MSSVGQYGVMSDVSITYQIEDYLAGKDLELDWVLKDIEDGSKAGL